MTPKRTSRDLRICNWNDPQPSTIVWLVGCRNRPRHPAKPRIAATATGAFFVALRQRKAPAAKGSYRGEVAHGAPRDRTRERHSVSLARRAANDNGRQLPAVLAHRRLTCAVPASRYAPASLHGDDRRRVLNLRKQPKSAERLCLGVGRNRKRSDDERGERQCERKLH